MAALVPALRNLSDLRDFVNSVLCEQGQFEIGAFPLTERLLTRVGKPCGIYFCLHGPRAVKLSAIWDLERNAVLFYGSTGERFHRAQLVDAHKLAPQLAVA